MFLGSGAAKWATSAKGCADPKNGPLLGDKHLLLSVLYRLIGVYVSSITHVTVQEPYCRKTSPQK